MKKILSVLLFVLVSHAHAQDTIYLHDPNDTIATTKEKALYYKTINTSVNPIEVSVYYTNSNKYSKSHFSSLLPQIKDGEYESYFYNGKTKIKGSYINNKMEGAWLVYNKEKDFIETKTTFKDNLKHGRSFTFFENGKLGRMDIYVRDTLASSTCYDSIGNVIECAPIIDNNSFERAEVMPTFPGGVQALMHFLQINIKYPSKAREKGLQGKVIVKFIIDVDGTVIDQEILKNGTGSPELGEEAMRVVLQMPKWIPGTQKGKPVKVYFTLPITFHTE